MDTLVVYDSQFGNTEQIARAIAAVLGHDGQARLLAVADAASADLRGVDLLVVGGPTQVHGASPATRSFVDGLADGALGGVSAASFDTRVRGARLLTGSAAVWIARRLARKGARLLAPPESFFVAGREGPLVDGEVSRAAAWAASLRQRAAETAGTRAGT